MKKEDPLVNSEYLLQKFPGKGGWTYAEIPEVSQNNCNPFGWVKVKGTIDGFELNQYKLMPMGDGKLFLPVKAEIRKRIGKREGDFVKVVLYSDDSVYKVPMEIKACFQNESNDIQKTFERFTEGEQKAYIDWIESAKKEETKAQRIAKMMIRLELKLKYNDRQDND